MLSSLWVPVSFAQTKVNDVNDVTLSLNSNQEIIRLYVSVQKTSRVEILDSSYHLVRDHEHCFQTEFTTAVIKQVLE